MKILMKALLLFALFVWPVVGAAQLLVPKTDLVIMLIWQTADGAVTDKRYVRHTETSEAECLDARGKARIVWSARKNTNMLGQSLCLAPGVPVPTLTIGTFEVIVDDAVTPDAGS